MRMVDVRAAHGSDLKPCAARVELLARALLVDRGVARLGLALFAAAFLEQVRRGQRWASGRYCAGGLIGDGSRLERRVVACRSGRRDGAVRFGFRGLVAVRLVLMGGLGHRMRIRVSCHDR